MNFITILYLVQKLNKSLDQSIIFHPVEASIYLFGNKDEEFIKLDHRFLQFEASFLVN